MNKLKRILDIDQLLIFFLLAVTVNQMAHYLATFAPDGWGFVAWFQAVAIDAAIWRSAYWFRRYTGRNQRRYALIGMLAFAGVSTWYNHSFYLMQNQIPVWQAWLMGAVLPGGVALLSYLHGVKDSSKFAAHKPERKERKERKPAETLPETWREFLAKYPDMLEMTGKRVGELAGVSERTGNNWKRHARNGKGE